MDNVSEVPQVKDRKGMALASMILGLVGIVVWLLPILGVPVTIIGLILGILGVKSSRKGMAIAGIILCSLFLLASIGSSVIGALFLSDLYPMME